MHVLTTRTRAIFLSVQEVPRGIRPTASPQCRYTRRFNCRRISEESKRICPASATTRLGNGTLVNGRCDAREKRCRQPSRSLQLAPLSSAPCRISQRAVHTPFFMAFYPSYAGFGRDAGAGITFKKSARRDIECSPTDTFGSSLTHTDENGGLLLCTYVDAGTCTYFPVSPIADRLSLFLTSIVWAGRLVLIGIQNLSRYRYYTPHKYFSFG